MNIRLMVTILLALACTAAGADQDVRKLSTEPRLSVGGTGAEAVARMDFYFGDIRAWLLEDGSWHIEGMVQHHSALCGEYELGIQFGVGSPGCANVQWLGEPDYGTYQIQCNNALVRHVGGGNSPIAAQNFKRINCGQRLIRCDGFCK
ncbi:MAG TPA: hypothetical protein VFB20_05265 [Burkholderiales bacterium]|nr:hypothetical protein [Burkholderiales bacterium]